ncbi:MAG: thiamine biosynthesis lipoprotein [Limisphaerales bacterium]|nr:MAG: thiamine biosynthesis lipoprotein [Limisphaerales bacterium]KAG0508539.1 MAG: thiamine biosynthesis lipoprotein [Limisphaerales bacterium]TXT50149.1 MAG: thiamine biosynthesis lipoprotein [Limisphaerales bacterium]
MSAAQARVERRCPTGALICLVEHAGWTPALRRALLLSLILLYFSAHSLSAAEPAALTLHGFTMGSTWSAKYRPATNTPPARAVEQALQARLDDLEQQMSTWRADSDLSRFNASRDTNWFPVPRDTALVVREALEVSRLTDGAFDVTVFPLVQLWGFGPGGRKGRVPSDAEITAALKRVGWQKLHVRLDPPALRKSQADVAVDLSALCPGYASDCLGEKLEALGVSEYLVEVGGEFRARGNGALGPGWRVGVERPEARAGDLQSPSLAGVSTQNGDYKSPARALAATLTLTNQSLATSGDYRNFFTVGSRRFSHHLDPRSGWPTDSAIASISVVHSHTMRADALGTALTVLGFERAWALAEREKFGVLFILRDDERLVPRRTSHWPQLSEPE